MGKKPRNKSSLDTTENIISGYNDKNQELQSTSATTKYNKKFKPLVSVCTPTFNRRPFIASMIACFKHQDYPADKMEWIIIDDGTDKI